MCPPMSSDFWHEYVGKSIRVLLPCSRISSSITATVTLWKSHKRWRWSKEEHQFIPTNRSSDHRSTNRLTPTNLYFIHIRLLPLISFATSYDWRLTIYKRSNTNFNRSTLLQFSWNCFEFPPTVHYFRSWTYFVIRPETIQRWRKCRKKCVLRVSTKSRLRLVSSSSSTRRERQWTTSAVTKLCANYNWH